MTQLKQELENWRIAYKCLRLALRITLLSKAVPQEKKDDFHLRLELLSDDAQDLGDLLEKRIENQKPKEEE